MMIYCVEDDDNIRDLVIYALNSSGFLAAGFPDSNSFFQRLKRERPLLVLLDIMLPGTDGLSVLKQLKANSNTRDIPVIMLTAKGSEFDKVQGLDMGADDYVTKPFGVMELISRIKSVLRRTAPKAKPEDMHVANITLNKEKHRVLVDDEEIRLTFKEFELLQYLMENEGIVLSREKLLERIWGYDFEGETRTVDVHIRTLRRKLGTGESAIETVRGVGYRIGGTR